MKNSALREKDRIVLQTIIEDYLKNGQPVSSGVIHQKKVLNDSPATIRNVMVKLEELGFLAQPHASAGRIPTDRGLRYYVNSLLAEEPRAVDLSGPLGENRTPTKDDLNAQLSKMSE